MHSSFRRFLTAAALLPVLLAVSCQEEAPAPATVSDAALPAPAAVLYTIKKGGHTAQHPLKLTAAAVLRFEAAFDSSARYTSAVAGNQADINKLYGLSDCGTDHHTNSARFGWRWYEGRLEIHAYVYYNKKRNTAYITSVQPGQTIRYELELREKEYLFRVGESQVSLPRYCATGGSRYQLYPYFGGDETAPHDITIRIREI